MIQRATRPAGAVWLAPLLLLVLTITVVGAAADTPLETTAGDRYVAPAGNDLAGANSCASAAAPCRTVRQALVQAAQGDTVWLAAGSYAEAELPVTRPVTLRGAGVAVTTIDGGRQGTVMTVDADAVLIAGLTIRAGLGVEGGALHVAPDASLTLRDVSVTGSEATLGGGIYSRGRVWLEDSQIVDNRATSGGGVYNEGGQLVLVASELGGNAAEMGGGLFNGPGGTASVARGRLVDNRATLLGGAVHDQSTALNLLNTLVSGNRAGDRGGGLYNDGGEAYLSHTTWLGNEAARGGALAGSGETSLRNSILTGSRGGDCDGPVSGRDSLLDDPRCGLPVNPATGVLADGRLAPRSNAIDAIAPLLCTVASSDDNPLYYDGQGVAVDIRNEARPVDGDLNGNGRCDAGAFEFQPRIAILHNSPLPDGTRFALDGSLGTFWLSAAGPTWQAFESPPGAYTVTMQRKAGWKVSAIACTGDADGGSVVDVKGRTVAIDLDAGERITCVFTSKPIKASVGVAVAGELPTGLAVAFSGDIGAFALAEPEAADYRAIRLAPAPYRVQAQPPPGWAIDGISCAGDTDGGSTVDLAAGAVAVDLDTREVIGCTFTVGRSPAAGSLTIVAAAAGGGEFAYTGDLGLFTLRAPAAELRRTDLRPGAYRIHELLHPRWTLEAITCSGDADRGSAITPEDASVLVDLDAGESIVCTFRHGEPGGGRGSIAVSQVVDGADGTAFTYGGTLGAFTLQPPQTPEQAWTGLPPGRYIIQQQTPDGWALDGITCAGDADNRSVIAVSEGRVELDLDAGEAIACAFSNSRQAGGDSIAVTLAASPADNTRFRFSGDLGAFALRDPGATRRSFTALAPGQYELGLALPAGWHVAQITCGGDADGGSVIDENNAAVVLDLDPGERLACAFAVARDEAPPPAGDAVPTYVPLVLR